MGNRLTKIVTRTGDDGNTGLGDGTRISKNHPRINAIGDIDELNCQLGLLLSCPLPDHLRSEITGIQHRLFDIGAELSIPSRVYTPGQGTGVLEGAQAPETKTFPAELAQQLENFLDKLNKDLPPLREFILPGGSQSAAVCHLARAVCRRSERQIVNLSEQEAVNTHIIQYINRLSDLLFVIARTLSRQTGGQEAEWHSPRRAHTQQTT